MGVCEAVCRSVYIEGRLCGYIMILSAHECLNILIGSVKTDINMHNVPIFTLKASSHDNKLYCPTTRECSEPHFCIKDSSALEACW